MHIAHVCKFNAICVYRSMNIAFGNFLHNSIQNMCVRKVTENSENYSHIFWIVGLGWKV